MSAAASSSADLPVRPPVTRIRTARRVERTAASASAASGVAGRVLGARASARRRAARRWRARGRSRAACARARVRSSRCTCRGSRRVAESTKKPCAKPGGIQSCRWFSAESVDADPAAEASASRGGCRPRRRRPRRAPRAPACPAALRIWKCRPRSMPLHASASGCPARTSRVDAGRARSAARW